LCYWYPPFVPVRSFPGNRQIFPLGWSS